MDWGEEDRLLDTDIDGNEYTDPAAHHRPTPERRAVRWYQHPSLRLGEILTIVSMIVGFVLFAREYDQRIVLLTERVDVIRAQLRIMQEQPGNSLTQPSPYSLQKFHEHADRMDRIDRAVDYQRNYVLKLEERVNELYYGRPAPHK